MATDQLPHGFEVQLKGDLIPADGGRVLVGGSPARAVRLSGPAHALIRSSRVVVGDSNSAHLARRLLDGNLADPVVDNIEVESSDLTVVVPVRDRADQLDRCLAALTPLRVVAVDDASADPEAIARVAERHGARLISLHENLGPAGARNAGLALVTTPFVAFVDSDVVVDSGALLTLARHLTDPLVALVGPAVVGKPRNARPRWFERYDAAASSLDLGRTGYQVRPGSAVAWLPSACLVGRVDRLGSGFDPTMRVGEDVDLVWRLDAAGSVVRYDPTVTASHDVRTTARAWLSRKFVYGTGGADLAARHGVKVAPAALSLATALGAAAILQRRWWSVPIAALTVATTTRKLSPRLPVERGRTVLGARLSARGLGWAVRQESGLLLRHWWPLTALAVPFSRSVRRALATAVVLDLVLFLRERPGVDPFTVLVARRVDDLAYGSGLWCGAARRRSARCLLVRRLDRTNPG
jgi:mycofactocin system glycosyltransferase